MKRKKISLVGGPRFARPFWLCGVIVGFVVLFSSGVAVVRAETDPVTTGKDALTGPYELPWYDSGKDDLKAIPLAGSSPNSNPPPSQSSGGSGNRSGRGGSGSRGGSGKSGGDGHSGGGDESGDSPDSSPSIPPPSGSLGFITWIAWAALAVALCGLAYMLIRAFLDREARDVKNATTSDAVIDPATEAERAAELPTKVPTPRGGLLDEIRKAYEAGDYDTAIIYLYSYELLKLDRSQCLRLTKGKTNREYLRELNDRPELRDLLSRCLSPFEDVFFGGHKLDRTRFEACWNDVDRFHRLLGEVA